LTKDFFYICPAHLKDRGFCSPIIDLEQEAAKKRQDAIAAEVEKLKQEYEERQKKKDKGQEKSKGKDTDENESKGKEHADSKEEDKADSAQRAENNEGTTKVTMPLEPQ
jgi:AAA-ATPase Vps4-associated protein 1